MQRWERQALYAMDQAYLGAVAALAEEGDGEELTAETYEKIVAGGA